MCGAGAATTRLPPPPLPCPAAARRVGRLVQVWLVNRSSSKAGAPPEPDLPSYQVVLTETDWGSLQTAFGSGECLPEVLARLLEPDPKVQVTALSELSELVGHQSTVYEATGPVALYVGILAHPATMTLRPYRNVPVRATLLNWLASTAYDASDEMVDRIERYFPGFLTHGTTMVALRDLRPILYRAVAPFLQDSHEDVREASRPRSAHPRRTPRACPAPRSPRGAHAPHPGHQQRRP